MSWASLGNLKWVDGNCTLPLAFRKEVSRVMPQSPHKPGNQKRGLEHGERTETPYFCHSLPRYTPHPPQVLAGLGDRGWDCLPSSREAPLSLSPGVFWCSIALCISSSCCVNLHHPSFLCFANLPFASLMSGLPGCLLHGSRLYAFQALWQCFPQAPLVPPHTTNSHAAHRRMRGGRNEEEDYRGELIEEEGVGVGGLGETGESSPRRVVGQVRKTV